MTKKLVLIELNELNFDVVKQYIDSGVSLPGFDKLLSQGILTTLAEENYEQLEPWIQWPSVHTGKTYDEHQIFRLGDAVNSNIRQFFELVENAGFSVGAISPMNAVNRLKAPAYFIPDPWTKTQPDRSFMSQAIAAALRQAVNDNSDSKLTTKTIMSLLLAFAWLVRPTRYFGMTRYALSAVGKPWRKALFLDMFLYEIHRTLLRRKQPDFTTLFLNAGAHIQHHYFHNSKFVSVEDLKNPSWYIGEDEDPVLEMLHVYDEIILGLLEESHYAIMIATGLSQTPYPKLKFYYRLKDHEDFLNKIGIENASVSPRMTRDFLVSFNTVEQALLAEEKLSKIMVDGVKPLFGEIDNRGKDIFVVLNYPFEITDDTVVSADETTFSLLEHVVFVAIKNGEHQSKGFVYLSDALSEHKFPNESHVSKLHDIVVGHFCSSG